MTFAGGQSTTMRNFVWLCARRYGTLIWQGRTRFVILTVSLFARAKSHAGGGSRIPHADNLRRSQQGARRHVEASIPPLTVRGAAGWGAFDAPRKLAAYGRAFHMSHTSRTAG